MALTKDNKKQEEEEEEEGLLLPKRSREVIPKIRYFIFYAVGKMRFRRTLFNCHCKDLVDWAYYSPKMALVATWDAETVMEEFIYENCKPVICVHRTVKEKTEFIDSFRPFENEIKYQEVFFSELNYINDKFKEMTRIRDNAYAICKCSPVLVYNNLAYVVNVL